MKTPRKHRGMSLLGLLFVLIVLAVLGLGGLKLFPVYLESIKVASALKGVIEDPNIGGQSKRDIAFSLVRRLDIDGSYLISEQNWKEFLTIDKKKDRGDLQVQWRKEVELFGNLSLVASFTTEVSNRP